jgi:hypothetical protein
MKKMQGKREPKNKPIEFIEHLELLNLLPENLDNELKTLAENSEQLRHYQGLIDRLQRKNLMDRYYGREVEEIPSEHYQNSSYYRVKTEEIYNKIFLSLPEKLQNYIREDQHWSVGERFLHLLAFEKESLELIIAQRKFYEEYQKELEEWKKTQNLVGDNNEIEEKFKEHLKNKNPNYNKYVSFIPYVPIALYPFNRSVCLASWRVQRIKKQAFRLRLTAYEDVNFATRILFTLTGIIRYFVPQNVDQPIVLEKPETNTL